jgi:hypothetical protein
MTAHFGLTPARFSPTIAPRDGPPPRTDTLAAPGRPDPDCPDPIL